MVKSSPMDWIITYVATHQTTYHVPSFQLLNQVNPFLLDGRETFLQIWERTFINNMKLCLVDRVQIFIKKNLVNKLHL